jgi:hypothetical protein
MDKTEIFERIFADQPSFHRVAETGCFRTERSALPDKMRDRIASLTGRQNWGISKELGRYLLDVVTPDMRTLETGAGVSTLIFAMGGSQHTAVAPFGDEMEEMRNYAATIGIDASRVTCVASGSEKYLPTLTDVEFDIVFIDGMHAFPWPILDWYSTADHLKVGGLMIIDDTQLPSVGTLCEFLRFDTPRWLFAKTVGERTDVFKKIASSIHDVAWHEQPWVAAREQLGDAGRHPFHRRVASRLRRFGTRSLSNRIRILE